MQKKTAYRAEVKILREPHPFSKYHQRVLETCIYILSDNLDISKINEFLREKRESIEEELKKRYRAEYGTFKVLEINFEGKKEEIYLKAIDERALFDLRDFT